MSNTNSLKRWLGRRKRRKAFRAGQWQLVWWKFRRHKLAQLGTIVLAILYFIAIFAGFVSPHDPLRRFKQYLAHPPTAVHIRDESGRLRRPFIYGTEMGRDPETFRPVFEEDRTIIYPIGFFVPGDSYE